MNSGTSSKRPAVKKPQLSDLFAGDDSDEGGTSSKKDAKKSRVEAPPPPPTAAASASNASPLDEETKGIADKLALFVGKNGRSYEELTRQRNPGASPFRFLFDTKCAAYVYYDQQVTQIEAQQRFNAEEPGYSIPSPAAPQPRTHSQPQHSTAPPTHPPVPGYHSSHQHPPQQPQPSPPSSTPTQAGHPRHDPPLPAPVHSGRLSAPPMPGSLPTPTHPAHYPSHSHTAPSQPQPPLPPWQQPQQQQQQQLYPQPYQQPYQQQQQDWQQQQPWQQQQQPAQQGASQQQQQQVQQQRQAQEQQLQQVLQQQKRLLEQQLQQKQQQQQQHSQPMFGHPAPPNPPSCAPSDDDTPLQYVRRWGAKEEADFQLASRGMGRGGGGGGAGASGGSALESMDRFAALAARRENERRRDAEEEDAERRARVPLMNETSFDRRKTIAVFKTDGSRGHHMQDFIPPEELAKFMAKSGDAAAAQSAQAFEAKGAIKADNIGHKLLSKMGWREGEGVGAGGAGITAPVKSAGVQQDGLGLGAQMHGEVTKDDDPFEAYRKRMQLGYKHRPNPLGNPRKSVSEGVGRAPAPRLGVSPVGGRVSRSVL
ncbi:MAG: hypothetical protein WDW36_004249 [Sanguina aurantia]